MKVFRSPIRKKPGVIKESIKRFIDWIRLRIYGILYFILIVTLSVYIVLNWDKCLSMKFFEQFDGNNILFLVWIALLILFFYDIEAKDMKFHRKRIEDTKKQFAEADSVFQQNQINDLRDHLQAQSLNESDEGGNIIDESK